MSGWLILIHQLPPKPDYVRVKVGRRLSRIGAIALKNTVYVRPDTESTLEDLQWTARESDCALLADRQPQSKPAKRTRRP